MGACGYGMEPHPFAGAGALCNYAFVGTQRLQNPLIKEYTLNLIRVPIYYNLRYIPYLRGFGVSGEKADLRSPSFQEGLPHADVPF